MKSLVTVKHTLDNFESLASTVKVMVPGKVLTANWIGSEIWALVERSRAVMEDVGTLTVGRVGSAMATSILAIPSASKSRPCVRVAKSLKWN